MTCMETQNMIMQFINNELDIDELDDFLKHIKTCLECMEETEVYYTLITSMKQLDCDQELSGDYRQDLIDLLEKSEEKIDNKKVRFIRKRLSLFIIIGLIALTSTFRIGEFVVEDVIKKATVSNFTHEELVLLPPNELPQELEEQLPGIYLYLRQVDKDGAATMEEHFGSSMWNDMIIQKEFGQATYIPEWTVLYY